MIARRQGYPPEYDLAVLCAVCGQDAEAEDGCSCPECPRCTVVGDPDCYQQHGLKPANNSVQSFCEHVGIEPVADALRAIDKHNPEHVWLVLSTPHEGKTRLYYHDREALETLPPHAILDKVGVGGIAWDGSDWESSEEVPAGNGWHDLDAARQGFHQALDDYTGSYLDLDLNENGDYE